MGFTQSFVKICQLVKAAMGHAHINAQHILSFLFGKENTPKTINLYSFGLLSIWAQKCVISEIRNHAVKY
jgi:hypothetical protein